MTPEHFLEQFGYLADAPNGIAKLRELILQLAASGILVQSSGATQYTLGNVTEFVMGQAPPGPECNKDGIGTVFVKTGEFGALYPTVREWTTKPLKLAQHGDVLICVVGATIGKLNLAIDCAIGRSVAAIRPSEKLDTKFLYYSLMPFVLRLREQSRGSAQGTITRTELGAIAIRVPSLDEQSRIVAKVDRLMALCDEFEAKKNQRTETHNRIVRAAHHPLTQPRNHPEFQSAWRRVRDNFDQLHTTLDSVKTLRQTILQLAVQGKLVPQDPDDEPASVLLEKIRAEKERLVAEGEIRKSESLRPIEPENLPFEVPQGWALSRLDDVVVITGGVTKGRNLAGRKVVSVPYLRVANVQRGHLDLDQMKEIDIPEDELRKYAVLERDLVITEGGDWDKVGRTAIWRSELPLVAHQNHVFKARRVLAEQNEVWLEKYLNSAVAREYFAGSSKQTTNLASINMTQLRGCVIPIPPLAEQHRIVAKINELITLCDELEAKIQANDSTAQRFAEAIVAELAA